MSFFHNPIISNQSRIAEVEKPSSTCAYWRVSRHPITHARQMHALSFNSAGTRPSPQGIKSPSDPLPTSLPHTDNAGIRSRNNIPASDDTPP